MMFFKEQNEEVRPKETPLIYSIFCDYVPSLFTILNHAQQS